MRIAVNASIYDQRPSGLGIYARSLLQALSRLHDDLIVYTSRPEALPFSQRIRAWGEPSRGWRGHLWRLTWTQIALPVHLRLGRADVLLNTLPEGPLRPPVPQVTVVHDVLPLYFPAAFPRQQWYFRSFIPAVLRRSVHIIADSAQTRDDVVDRYRLAPDRVSVVLPGVDHQQFHPQPDAGSVAAEYGLREFVLFVGNLRPHKNLLRLTEAVARLPSEIVLAVVGYRDPRYTPHVVRRIRELGMDGRVKLLGFVPSRILPHLYSAALVTAVPSLYEGFGMTALEAMACGSPVVASSTAGLREAAGDAAVLVDPLDVEGLASALARVATDRNLRAALRAKGLAHAARFRWEHTARSILDIARAAAG